MCFRPVSDMVPTAPALQLGARVPGHVFARPWETCLLAPCFPAGELPTVALARLRAPGLSLELQLLSV